MDVVLADGATLGDAVIAVAGMIAVVAMFYFATKEMS